MPTLETADGKPVDVTAPDPAEINRDFSRSMSDPAPGEQEKPPPKRRPRPADETDAPKPRRTRTPREQQARTAAPLDTGQRAAGVKGLVQLGAGLALLMARATGKDAFKADAVTIASSADEIAGACVQTAAADARFAAALDKVCSAGPYAALISVAVGVGAQVARNHKPALVIPGTVDPAELLAKMENANA